MAISVIHHGGVGNNDIGRTFCMVENWEVATKGISYGMTNWQWPSATMSIDYYYTNSYDHVPVLNTFTFETVYASHIRSLSWFRRMFVGRNSEYIHSS